VYLKTRTMEDKFINKKIRQHGHILKINKERIPKKMSKIRMDPTDWKGGGEEGGREDMGQN
jgi:hypothetical protein